MISLLLFLDMPWEQAKGYLREDLERIQTAINTRWATIFPNGRLPFSGLVAATAGSVLVGRQSGSAGDFGQITLGAGLTMTGSVLSSTGGGGVDNKKVAARIALQI